MGDAHRSGLLSEVSLRLTGVEMAVEVHDGHGTIRAVDGPQERQGDGMVTAQRDDARQRLALLRRADLMRVGRGLAGEDAVVAFLDLVERPAVVIPTHEHEELRVSKLTPTILPSAPRARKLMGGPERTR